MIEVRDLTRRYANLTAVEALSFDVAPGEILGLVGPNGAGKTTTLRALCGILAPDAGSIRIGGHDIVRESLAAKRLLAYVPDTPHPFEQLTVAEHLLFIARVWRCPGAEERIATLLEELELSAKRDELATTLSRGMQQKLALACAFLHDPRVLLLDEPLSGLDPRGIRDMRAAIRQRASQGAAVLISSHMLELIEKICERVLILHRGRQRALGSVAQIRASTSLHDEASLEEIFFSVTEEEGAAGEGAC